MSIAVQLPSHRKRRDRKPGSASRRRARGEIVVHDSAEPESEVNNEMLGRQHLQLGDGGERMRIKIERRRHRERTRAHGLVFHRGRAPKGFWVSGPLSDAENAARIG